QRRRLAAGIRGRRRVHALRARRLDQSRRRRAVGPPARRVAGGRRVAGADRPRPSRRRRGWGRPAGGTGPQRRNRDFPLPPPGRAPVAGLPGGSRGDPAFGGRPDGRATGRSADHFRDRPGAGRTVRSGSAARAGGFVMVCSGERGAALLSVLLLVAVMATVAATALDRIGVATRLAGNAATLAQARLWLQMTEQL